MVENKNPRVLLLSYPRSGNSWVRYCLEYITKTETMEAGIYDETKKHEETFKGVFKRDTRIKPFIFKRHFHDEIPDFNVKKDFLIIILRNYKECLPRHLLNNLKNKKILTRETEAYIKNIGLYEKWNNNKLLIYYEDLMTNFEFTFNRVVDFLTLDNNRYKKLIENFNYHKEKSIKFYSTVSAISVTRGEDLFYHSKKLSPFFRNKLDTYIFKNARLIFTKYLARYQEKRNRLVELLRYIARYLLIRFFFEIKKLIKSIKNKKRRVIGLIILDILQNYLKIEF